MEFKFFFLIVLGVTLFIDDEVNAGGPTVESCTYYELSFKALFPVFNLAINDVYDKAIQDIQNYVAVNNSQPPSVYEMGVKDIGDKARANISKATYHLFGELSSVMPQYSVDDIANYAFSDGIPDYPLSCIEDLHAIYHAFLAVDDGLEQAVNAALEASGK